MSLARELLGRGHAVRATTRDPARRGELEATGAEPFVGDPDRVATLGGALDHVSVAYVLLGSASGAEQHVAALHGTRLEMLLTSMLDTTVHGIVYEAAGTVDAAVLRAGGARVRVACEQSRIPYALLSTDPSDHESWLAAAVGAADELLGASSPNW
jgi:uncharacterized protein YbjT (DUF2867 family)